MYRAGRAAPRRSPRRCGTRFGTRGGGRRCGEAQATWRASPPRFGHGICDQAVSRRNRPLRASIAIEVPPAVSPRPPGSENSVLDTFQTDSVERAMVNDAAIPRRDPFAEAVLARDALRHVAVDVVRARAVSASVDAVCMRGERILPLGVEFGEAVVVQRAFRVDRRFLVAARGPDDEDPAEQDGGAARDSSTSGLLCLHGCTQRSGRGERGVVCRQRFRGEPRRGAAEGTAGQAERSRA